MANRPGPLAKAIASLIHLTLAEEHFLTNPCCCNWFPQGEQLFGTLVDSSQPLSTAAYVTNDSHMPPAVPRGQPALTRESFHTSDNVSEDSLAKEILKTRNNLKFILTFTV